MGELSSGVRVARGASLLLVQGVASSLVGVVYFAVVARLLNVADLGRLSALGLVSSLFLTAGTLALPSAIVKNVSEHVGGGGLDEARGVFRSAIRLGVGLATACSILCFAASRPLASYLLGADEYTVLLNLLSLDVFLAVLLPFFSGGLQGLQWFGWFAGVTLLHSVVRHSVAMLALWGGLGLTGVLYGWIVGDLTATLLSAALTLRAFAGKKSGQALRSLLHYSSPLYVSSLLGYFLTSTDRYLILLLAGQAVLGIYSPAVTAFGVLALITNAMGSAIFPKLSEMFGRWGRGSLGGVAKVSSRYVFLVYVPLAFGLAVTARPVLALFVGDAFMESALPLVILCVSSALTCGVVIVNNVLLAMGRTTVFTAAGLVSLAVDLGFSFLLIGALGSTGAALARAAVILVSYAVPAWVLRRAYCQGVDHAALIKSVVASSIMALTVAGAQLVWSSKYLLLLYVAVGGVAYLGALRVLKALNRDDFKLVSALVPAKLHWVVDLAEKALT